MTMLYVYVKEQINRLTAIEELLNWKEYLQL